MSLPVIAKRLEKTIADNSPVILTGIGVAGTLTTAYLTGKATFKAAEILHHEADAQLIDPRDFKAKYVAEKVWKLYIPPAITATFTCAAIIGANRVGTRRAAALAAAYAITEKGFDEYKEKVIEKLGEGKERDVRDEIAQERIDKNPVSKTEVIITETGDVLCYDSISGRYFKSSVETLRKAQNDLNEQMLNNMYASLGDFYDLIGLPTTPYANEVGWNTDRLLEISFSTTLSENGVPCISLDYNISPVREYYGSHCL